MTNKKLVAKKLREYQQLADVVKASTHAQAKLKTEIEKMLIEGGEGAALVDGVKIEGFSVRMVSPMRPKFDKKKFVELGGDLNIMEQATEIVPSKAYIKITAPGETVDVEQD